MANTLQTSTGQKGRTHSRNHGKCDRNGSNHLGILYDDVILKEESTPRKKWQLVRVAQTYPSEDGLVCKVEIALGHKSLDELARKTMPTVCLERPLQNFVLVVPCDDAQQETRESQLRSH